MDFVPKYWVDYYIACVVSCLWLLSKSGWTFEPQGLNFEMFVGSLVLQCPNYQTRQNQNVLTLRVDKLIHTFCLQISFDMIWNCWHVCSRTSCLEYVINVMMDSVDVTSDEAFHLRRKDSDSSLPPPRKDSNSSTSSKFSFKSIFGRHDSGISTASSFSSSEHTELESNLSLDKNNLSEDADFSVDSIQNLNSLDSRRRSSGSTMATFKRSDSAESSCSRRTSEISLPTVTEDEESEVGDDDDWKRRTSLSSYSLSSIPSLASIKPTDTPTPPTVPITREEQRTRVKSKSLGSTEIADRVSTKVRKLSMSALLESSLNKFKNMKADVVESFRRVSEGSLDTPIVVMPPVRINV